MKKNKLIAEFMGFPTQTDVVDDRTLAYYVGKSIIHTDNTENENDNDVFHPDDMQFHTSWDWLMPVVEKIESLRNKNGDGYRFTIDMCNTHIEGSKIGVIGASCKIDAVYQSVVEFINLKTNNEELNCEFCDKEMKEEDHNFCDICDECRQEV